MYQFSIHQNNDKQITWLVSTIVFHTHINRYMFKKRVKKKKKK